MLANSKLNDNEVIPIVENLSEINKEAHINDKEQHSQSILTPPIHYSLGIFSSTATKSCQ